MTTLASATQSLFQGARAARYGLLAGVAAASAFILVDLADGLLRPDYSLLRHWLSHRALGEFGWVGTASIAVTSLLLLAFGDTLSAVARNAEKPAGYAWTMVLAALALLAAALFPMDPSLGFPPATPQPSAPTVPGRIHDVAGPVFILALAGSAVLSRRFLQQLGDPPTWSSYGRAVGAAIVLAFVLTAVLVSLDYAGVMAAQWSGATERIAIYLGLVWTAAVAAWARRSAAT